MLFRKRRTVALSTEIQKLWCIFPLLACRDATAPIEGEDIQPLTLFSCVEVFDASVRRV